MAIKKNCLVIDVPDINLHGCINNNTYELSLLE